MKPLCSALCLAALCLPAYRLAAAGPATFSSGNTRVSLIELYTSEGCSSCPPAEAWMATRGAEPGLWKTFVPVSFHVSYWDNLGWKDPLSSLAYTQREYAYAHAWGAQNVYTPCFVRDGLEWKPSYGGARSLGGAAGTLSIVVTGENAFLARYSPTFTDSKYDGGFDVHVALLGAGLSSNVTAGENAGRVLTHEFAVIAFGEAHLLPMVNLHQVVVHLPRPAVDGAKRLAIAAWVTHAGEVEPLQATGGWLRKD